MRPSCLRRRRRRLGRVHVEPEPWSACWRPDWPCPVPRRSWARLRRGAGDPTYRTDADGTIWKALRAPREGPATLRVRPLDAGAARCAAAPGARAPTGCSTGCRRCSAPTTTPPASSRHHDVLAEAWPTHPHWRVPRTRLVMESLVPAILEQKVTGKEAFASQRRLVQRYGEPAPGPGGASSGCGCRRRRAMLRRSRPGSGCGCGVDPARSRDRRQRRAPGRPALERLVDVAHAEADRRLRTLPGVGVWTSAEVRSRALGDPDAVSFGDYHVAKDVGWALTGRPVDDAGLAELLEPYRPHRLRVQVLVGLAGLRRRGAAPRMTLPTHLPG